MKRTLSMLLTAVLFLGAFIAPSANAAVVKVDYVALGDSIAAGQTPNKTIGTGYTDMIAAALQSQGALSSFTKEFAVSGETSTQFLAKLQQEGVQAKVKNAELITISTGANDILNLVKSGNMNLENAQKMLAQVKANLEGGIKKIKELNPNAKIYVFGYYFPYPHMEAGELKSNYQLAFSIFNSELKATATGNGAHFVEINTHFKAEYLPNPADVHPSEAGYKLFADQFFKVWQNSTTPEKDRFTDIGKLGSQGRTAIIKLSEAGIISGNTDGTFAPKNNITRAETAIIMARALNKTGTPKNPGFSDVSPNMKSYAAIARLKEAGIFATASKFNPDKPLTRAQLARVLTQALSVAATSSANFKDVPANHWAKVEIDVMYANGIMSGGTNNMFYPEKNITREQFAMTVYNVWSKSLLGSR